MPEKQGIIKVLFIKFYEPKIKKKIQQKWKENTMG